MNFKENKLNIYTPELIAFAQVGVEFASLMEQGDDKQQAIPRLLHLLPRLYSLILNLPTYFYNPDEDFVEEYITEIAYEKVRSRWQGIFAEEDLYLSTFSLDVAQGDDRAIALSLGEQLADVYQHVGNLLCIIRERNELALPAAIGRCYLYWREYWGLALISALGALHQLYQHSEVIDVFENENYYCEEGNDEA